MVSDIYIYIYIYIFLSLVIDIFEIGLPLFDVCLADVHKFC